MACRLVRTWATCWAAALLVLACSSSNDTGGSGGSRPSGVGGAGPASGSGGSGGGQVVTTSGGTVTQDGVTISVPEGAVLSDTAISISTVSAPSG